MPTNASDGPRQSDSVTADHLRRATALVQAGRIDQARPVFEMVLKTDPANISAHWAMYEMELIAGNTQAALDHQQHVLRQQRLFTERAPRETLRALVFLAPGDWQANVPIDFLVDRTTTTLHKFFVGSASEAREAALPPADLAFNAIAESGENHERLATVAALMQSIELPVVNRPENVMRTNRVRLYEALRGLPDAVVPPVEVVTRNAFEGQGAPIAVPYLVRPVDSQAGRDLVRIDEPTQLMPYLRAVRDDRFYVMPFIDFSQADGYFRKYRIIVVDGTPYPYHLAVSPRWMIHYYNAPMRENAWMRDEEHRFLSDFERVFGPPLQRALAEMARILDLEYFGIDCSIDRDGRLVLFEADPAMLVHAADDPALFGYKRPYVQRIFDAFGRLLARVGSR